MPYCLKLSHWENWTRQLFLFAFAVHGNASPRDDDETDKAREANRTSPITVAALHTFFACLGRSHPLEEGLPRPYSCLSVMLLRALSLLQRLGPLL